MADVKLVVIYPRPKDVEAFEKAYTNEHVPLAVAKLGGKTKSWVRPKVFLLFTALQRCTSPRCRRWKRVPLLKAERKRWLTQ